MTSTSVPNTPRNNYPPYPLRVTQRDFHDWQRALTRGQEQRLEVRQLNTIDECGVAMTGYMVTSHSDPSSLHACTVSRDWEGDVYTICDCEAGQYSQPCTHAALSINTASLWPFPIASQTDMGSGS